MNNICEKLIKKYDLFWQYPVISELTVFKQQCDNDNYIGLPWATILDKNINIQSLLLELKIEMNKLDSSNNKLDSSNNKKYITFCQHISFRKIIDILKFLNINILYTSHKIKSEDKIKTIIIKPAPLYAVNIEDETRNIFFKKMDLFKLNLEDKYKILNNKKDIYYSFIGGYNPSCYLTKIRYNILKMKHHKKSYVKSTKGWHFENIVYQEQVRDIKINELQKKTHDNSTTIYNMVLLRSRYSLCPSGSGPNSIRLWESLAVGSIPILLADTLELPKHELWKKAILFVSEKYINNIVEILSKITKEKEEKMRKNCLIIYNHFKGDFLKL
tara:strand:+ start:882 stop:1868 length:987 start_codon:yes stop_codon:yes gene_type:complete